MRHLKKGVAVRWTNCCLALVLLFCLGMAAQAREYIRTFINDASGSPVMVLGPDGSILARYAYAPFGSQVAVQSAARQRLGFVGGIKETAGLHYLKHRYYNPLLGRFYQPDPVGFLDRGATQINRYGYGMNDPYTYQDKDGRVIPILVGAAAAMAPEEMAALTIGCARFCMPFMEVVEGFFNPGAPSVAGFAQSKMATAVRQANAELGAVANGAKGTFNQAAQSLSSVGQQNIRSLRGWAESKGWVRQAGDGPEVWGVRNADGGFSWRLKLKPEASTRDGLGAGSAQPRFDARLDAGGTYVNPFTGETGGRAVGTHLPLEKSWW